MRLTGLGTAFLCRDRDVSPMFALLFKMHHAFGNGLNALEIGLRVLDEGELRGDGARN
ncbi:MAG: hypothetical protein ACRDRB_14320 [Pseudonocardiaceae bacterium]